MLSSVSVSLRSDAPEPAHFPFTAKMSALVIHNRAGVGDIVNPAAPPAAAPFHDSFKFKFQGLPPSKLWDLQEDSHRIFPGSRRCPDIAESIPSGES